MSLLLMALWLLEPLMTPMGITVVVGTLVTATAAKVWLEEKCS